MKLHYKVFGQGEPIVILHGLFGMLDNWTTVAKALAEEYMVFVPDMRNHGRSPHDKVMHYRVMAEDIREFMEDNWIYSASVIGHSMGGKVAMQFALDFPAMLRKLVVVDVAPKAYQGGHESIFEALMAVNLNRIATRRELELELAYRVADTPTRQLLLKNLTLNSETERYEWRMNLTGLWAAYPSILDNIALEGRFDNPTLFLKGGQSTYILEHQFPLYREYFSEAQLVVIESAGHWIHSEQPNLFIDKVRIFLTN